MSHHVAHCPRQPVAQPNLPKSKWKTFCAHTPGREDSRSRPNGMLRKQVNTSSTSEATTPQRGLAKQKLSTSATLHTSLPRMSLILVTRRRRLRHPTPRGAGVHQDQHQDRVGARHHGRQANRGQRHGRHHLPRGQVHHTRHRHQPEGQDEPVKAARRHQQHLHRDHHRSLDQGHHRDRGEAAGGVHPRRDHRPCQSSKGAWRNRHPRTPSKGPPWAARPRRTKAEGQR